MKVAKFKINYIPHTGQIEVRRGIQNSEANVIIIDGSRGWGKSLFAVCEFAIPTMLSAPNKQVLWVAPTYKICKAPIDDVWNGVDEKTGERYIPDKCAETGYKFWEYKAGDGEIHMFNNSKLYIRSATNPDSIVAKGYSLVIIDEAALISKDVFEKQILATARRENCKIVIISTPRGKNWFHKLYLKGQDKSNSQYVSFKQPWWKRDNYPPLLIELMKDLPEHIRKQEFEAEFLDDTGGTFTNFYTIFSGKEIEFESKEQEWSHPNVDDLIAKTDFVVAVDLAKSVDFTVISVLDIQTKQLVYYRRINKVSYKKILSIIHDTANKFNSADIIYDATGVGSAFGDFLSTDYNVHGYVFTNQSKNELINKLIIAFDYTTIKLPNILTIRNEFEMFQFGFTKTGLITYSAPDGYHDDCVFSIAMANWYIDENGGGTEVKEIDNFLQVANSRQSDSFYDFIDNDND
jgi:hypothetical protein